MVGRYFYRNTALWNSDVGEVLNDAVKAIDPERMKQLNIHVVGFTYPDSSVGGWSSLSDFDISRDEYIITFNNEANLDGDWPWTTHLAHEIGHNLELNHTYNSEKCTLDDPDYLDDVFGPEIQPWCSVPNPGCDICYHEGGFECDPTLSSNTCTNNMMGGTKYSCYFSPKQIGRAHRTLSTRSTRKYVKTGAYSSSPLEITQNETWDFNIKLYQDLIIKSGAMLTLTCELHMVPGSKIIIEPNAKLIVDGALISNEDYGNSPWQGIQVWGNGNAHQYEINGARQQGFLELKNGAIIENAEYAVRLWHLNYWGSTGGIIQAENATFRNNHVAIEFMKYRNFDPNTGLPRPNLSYFKQCTFITDDDFEEVQSSNFLEFIYMWWVDGIEISGSRFEDSRSEFNYSEFESIGIRSIDANYRVVDNEHQHGNLFQGLNFGIYSSQVETLNTYLVAKSVFNKNQYSIYNSANHYPTYILNTFQIGTKLTSPPYLFNNIGVLITNSTGYTIEQNSFSKYQDYPSDYLDNYGIWIHSSGENSNSVYNNIFSGLHFGNVATGLNRIVRTPEIGLTYDCNQNISNVLYDFYVNDPSYGEGIAIRQGVPGKAAGNTFTHNTTPLGSDFCNLGNYLIQYFHSGGIQEPLNYLGLLKTITSSNSCPSHFEGKNIFLTSVEQDSLREQFHSNLIDYNSIKTLFESLKDGGDTPGSIAEIENSWPDQTWQLRAKLLADSPHLSEEVLKAAADKSDVLPHTIMFEICMANPEEMRNEKFLEYLASKEDPMPQYMIDELRNGATESTFKGILQNEMAEYACLMGQANNNLIRNILSDTLGIQYDSLRIWLNNKNCVSGAYEIVQSYLAQGNYSEALFKLNGIPDEFELTGEQLNEYNYYHDLTSLIINVNQQI